MTAVGFIGLGQIGGPMAIRLLDWPGGLIVYDVRPEATEPFADKGARVATNPADVARSASVISVMVRDDDQVRRVMKEILAVAPAGLVVAIHSTIRPSTAEELAENAGQGGIAVVDAPVAGGFMGASAGTLAVMAGGDASAVDRCREPFGRWAQLVAHVGPVGAGTRAKLARNLLQFAAYSAAGEAQRLAEAAGVDLRQLGDVVRHSDRVTGGPGAIMLRDTTAAMTRTDPLFDILAHTLDLGLKDLRLALELGEQLGVPLPFAELSLEHLAPALGLLEPSR